MYSPGTIAAISTPLGTSGIGIVRLSGSDSINIASKVFLSPKRKTLSSKSHVIQYGYIFNPETGKKIDEALISIMKSPRSYTREDIVEINCHGGIVPLREVLEVVLANGARLADPGEFTKRAFLNGRIDLAQAEAVIDIINSRTEVSLGAAMRQLEGALSTEINKITDKVFEVMVQLEAAIDFSEEDLNVLPRSELSLKLENAQRKISNLLADWENGRILREGIRTTIVGRPNVGKSSLLNALLRENRCIVTSIPGTTRDIIEETISIKGVPLVMHDTAGLRHPQNEVEQLGIELSKKSISEADLVLFVVDSSDPLHKEDKEVIKELKGKRVILVLNKSDLPSAVRETTFKNILCYERCVSTSTIKEEGINELEDVVVEVVFSGKAGHAGETLVTNRRHKSSLVKALEGITEALRALKNEESEEFVIVPLKDALESLGEIVGKVTSEDLIEGIFAQFCIGK
ncbi:tRNA uridine-5-carboxymethylaminomethyl(34) synthesis GTPase MnmE [Candidatus Oleimmundimicrobium sp.]|uniref:tRNA uridine-5-carboxymethylaminomethyl(34) synthesis GTPase MnmE n=1 Tax=Candidatus Oleimmundimicrobium sp. TaxID=3060597 RepID=UPI0027292A53|nr:tRNA uridine-5-carboxymethylaminomethyl(34) synthesis GTPase MnmE [Candidatus Oleimmundimicrobium sp.]MDO8886388.1 tRNA uridine-5-carboxymethylaminomethyl(34) synthesis GTPase MnmE [Candidatus Oleimmundimicrobium sp.]